MINVFEVYESAADKINPSENGDFSFSRFNRVSWLAQLRLLDWLSGDVSNITPPQPYLTSKNKAYLSPFITKYPVQVENGMVTKPSDYYLWENAYILGNYSGVVEDCKTEGEEETVVTKEGNTPIELLDGDKFNSRCHTYIEGLQPSLKKAITKEIGNTFEFVPKDTGSITIEYIRYPVKAKIGTVIDPVYNDEVYNPATSIDFEWSPFAQDILAWFVADQFSLWTREKALFEHNKIQGKTVRA